MKDKNNFLIDIFSETNPAFCSIVLFYFIKGYKEASKKDLNLGLLIIVLPVILSKEYRTYFSGTNKKTGLYKWILNHKNISFELSNIIKESSIFLKPAISFGFYKRIFELNDKGLLFANINNIKQNKDKELSEIFTYAERFGFWCGEINSPTTILNILGIENEEMEY